MGGLAFFRSLPRWARRLWYLILLIIAVELAVTIASLIWAPSWLWLTTEVFSLSAWPLGAGVALVVLVGGFTSRRRRPAASRSERATPASQPPPTVRGQEGGGAEGIEISAARSAARLWAQAARRPEGRAAIRRTGRFARAVRAAARPPQTGAPEPPHERAEDR
jgi:uncharacterized SAM-binding protein YcdF (DUF218 family)